MLRVYNLHVSDLHLSIMFKVKLKFITHLHCMFACTEKAKRKTLYNHYKKGSKLRIYVQIEVSFPREYSRVYRDQSSQ